MKGLKTDVENVELQKGTNISSCIFLVVVNLPVPHNFPFFSVIYIIYPLAFNSPPQNKKIYKMPNRTRLWVGNDTVWQTSFFRNK